MNGKSGRYTVAIRDRRQAAALKHLKKATGVATEVRVKQLLDIGLATVPELKNFSPKL